MKVAILCGGFATRLQPLTDHLPKSLIDVNGFPFIYHQLQLLREQRITEVVLCVGHLGTAILESVGTRFYNLRIEYSFDGDHPLGTAGALRKALPLLGDTFFVMYGDAYPLCDFATIEDSLLPEFDAMMVVAANDNPRHRNNVYMHGDRLVLYDKQYPTPRMLHLDYGVTVFRDYAIANSDWFSDLSDLYHQMSAFDWLQGYFTNAPLYNIGSPLGLDELRDYLKEKA